MAILSNPARALAHVLTEAAIGRGIGCWFVNCTALDEDMERALNEYIAETRRQGTISAPSPAERAYLQDLKDRSDRLREKYAKCCAREG